MKPLPKSLIAFTLLSGLGAGLIIVVNVARYFLRDSLSVHDFELPALAVGFVLLCLGFLASAVHLGKPGRAFNAMANPRSMIAQEAYWGIALILVTAVALVLSLDGRPQGALLSSLGIVAGAGLLTVTALVYAKARAIPMWNSASTLLSFWVSALLMGAAGSLIIAVSSDEDPALIRGLALATVALLASQILVTIGAEIEAIVRVRDVDLPDLLHLTLVRSIIGLLLPLVVMVLALQGSITYTWGGVLALTGVVLGESVGRVVFFSRGVHV